MDASRVGSVATMERHSTPGTSSSLNVGAGSSTTASTVAGTSSLASTDLLNQEFEGLLTTDELAIEIEIRTNPLPQEHATLVDLDKGLRLIQFCREGDFQNAKKLILEGAPAGFITKAGWTPLSAASFSGKISLVMYLLEIGADSMYKTNKRHQDTQQQQPSSVESNQSAANAINDSPNNANGLTSAPGTAGVSTPNSSTTTAGLNSPSKLSSTETIASKKRNATGCNTPLHWAAYKGHTEVVSILLQAGFSMEDADPVGNTALHLACAGSNVSCIEYFLANSVNTELKNQYGNAPLDLATEPNCRKLLLKFRKETHCEWCKEPFTRLRRASLCQHCHHVYCDAKPCSFTYEVPLFDTSSSTDNNNNEPFSSSSVPSSLLSMARFVRFCQDCASEMAKQEESLRQTLDQKLAQAQSLMRHIQFTSATKTLEDPENNSKEPAVSTGESPESSNANTGDPNASSGNNVFNNNASVDSNGKQEDSANNSFANDGGAFNEPFPTSAEELDKLQLNMTQQDIQKAMTTLTRADVESLYTAMETAQSKAADPRLLAQAKSTYHQLIAQVTLQEEIVSLFAQRPISVRAVLNPLKRALGQAKAERVDGKMILFATRVIQSAETECTLFGCHMLTNTIDQGTRKVAREIARLDTAIQQGKLLGVDARLLEEAQACQRRLQCEISLRESLLNFEERVQDSDANAGGAATATKLFVFPDKTKATSLLQALEMRLSRINAALESAAQTSGVSTALLEEAANIQKQLKKDIRDETKAEDERRKAEEEAAAKAAKKSKKKKA